MNCVALGEQAPDFTLPSNFGEEVSLSDFRGKKAVVLFFYPKDGTPVCTKEACGFRDTYEDFVEAGAVVIGVSSDSLESHKSFAAKNRLPFILLSDSEGSLRKAFGVQKSLGFMPGRVTYTIDKNGVVRDIFSSPMSAEAHVKQSLETVREIAQ